MDEEGGRAKHRRRRHRLTGIAGRHPFFFLLKLRRSRGGGGGEHFIVILLTGDRRPGESGNEWTLGVGGGGVNGAYVHREHAFARWM